MRLLLVEDDDELVAQMKLALTEEGYAVDRSADGNEGLDRAFEIPYDVIILDLMLPGLDGRSFLRNLRRECDTPVLILTARSGLEDRVGGLDDGADDYLTKPFELRELVARLRALVRRQARVASDEISFGDLTVDLARRKVSIQSRLIDLTVQEYRLVEVLALRGGEPISRHELWQRLAGRDDGVRSNVISVHIHNLRSKLGPQRIQTRHGFGYALVDHGE